MRGMVIMKNFYKNKRVLITGHTGFKGSWLSEILLQFGAEVCGYALESKESSDLYLNLKLHKNMNSYIGDIRNYDKLKKVFDTFKPEIVFHLAAQPIVRESYKNPLYTYETNVMGTVTLLEAVRHCSSVRSVVNVTTDKVYKNINVNKGYTETDYLCGQEPYSNSKSCSELVTYSYKKSFFDTDDSPAVSTARAGNVIGAGDFSKNRIIPDCVRAAFSRNKIEIRNPYSIRPYQYVMDCLYGYLLIGMKQYCDRSLAGAYNFGPKEDDCKTTIEIVDKFCHVWGDGLDYYTKPDDSVYESQILMLDSSKSNKLLNWNPQYDIDHAMHKTVELYKLIYEKNFDKYACSHIEDFFSGVSAFKNNSPLSISAKKSAKNNSLHENQICAM